MEMEFVGHFGQALPVWVVWELCESVQIPPVLGTCFLTVRLRGKFRLGYTRIALLLPDLESPIGGDHARSAGGGERSCNNVCQRKGVFHLTGTRLMLGSVGTSELEIEQ